MKLDIETLKQAVSGSAAAIRIVTRLEPVGHERDKVFPPTYAGGEYALEDRYPASAATVSADGNGPQTKGDEAPVQAVLLHSVAGQANLLEEALKGAIADGEVSGVPVLKVSFDGTAAAEYLQEPITVLDAPHRVFDAIFRDSEVPSAAENIPSVGFSRTDAGEAIAKASLANATPLYEWSPTSLLFGCWNSANDKVPGKIKGNLKFARAIVSEIVGYEIERGVRVGGKGDPAGITGQTIYRLPSDETTKDVKEAVHDEAKKPFYRQVSEALGWTQEKGEALKTHDKGNEVPVYRKIGWEWTTDERKAAKNKDGKPVKWGQKGKPSELLFGQIAPTIGKNKDDNNVERRKLSPDRQEELRTRGGGVTMKYALQTTVLSLSALRRLRFPSDQSPSHGGCAEGTAATTTTSPSENQSPERHVAARTVLAALGLVAITAQRERDYFLRSRCELRAVDSPQFEFVVQGRKIEEKDRFTLTFKEAEALLQQALQAPNAPTWKADSDLPPLKPKASLAELIRLSFVHGGADEEVEGSEAAADANDQ